MFWDRWFRSLKMPPVPSDDSDDGVKEEEERCAREEREQMREENRKHRMRIIELERSVQTHGRPSRD